MTTIDLIWLRYIAVFTVLVYFAFEYYDRKTLIDEREELIRLKTSDLTQKLTTWTATALAILFAVYPMMSAIFPIMAVVLAALYGDIAGKLYYRNNM